MKVFILRITHYQSRRARELQAFSTKEKALDFLGAYCRHHWGELALGKPPPETRSEVIRIFFEEKGVELDWRIAERALDPFQDFEQEIS